MLYQTSRLITLISLLFLLADSCRIRDLGDIAWSRCQCLPVGTQVSLHVVCRQSTTATIPLLTQENDQNHIVAITMNDGSLAFIQQDAFKGHNLQTLDFENNYIQTINVNAFRGIEATLQQLNIKNNNISVIPTWAFTYLHQLQSLDLGNNRISAVRSSAFEETQLHSLQFLHLDNNQINVIPTTSFYKLRLVVLSLSNNRIRYIEKLAFPTTLTFLDLSNNLLSTVPYLALKELSGLQSLNLESNQISTLHYEPEVQFKSEIKLVLRNNKIKQISENSLRSFRKFSELDMSYNQISQIHQLAFSSIASIKSLDLSYNTISVMHHGTLKNFAKNIERLNLEENNFHALPEALRDLQKLTYLNLNGNKLTTIQSDCISGFLDTLTELLLAYNHLKRIPITIFSSLKNLRQMDLSKNRIESIDDAVEFDENHVDRNESTQLKFLNLAGNQISEISRNNVFRHLKELTYLDISYNKLQQIDNSSLQPLQALEKLFLQNNQLRKFPNTALLIPNNVRHLILDNNYIEELPNYALEYLPRMEHFSLAKNKIHRITSRTFHASSCRNLISLIMDENQLEFIGEDFFSNIDNVRYISLTNNKITEIMPKAFTNLKKLIRLDLRGNRLFRLQSQTFTMLPSFEALLLAKNRLQIIESSALTYVQKLDFLDLSKNSIKHFNCTGMGSLSSLGSLDLSHNQITTIELTCIKRSLRSLNMADNKIRMLKKDTMQDFDALENLSLKSNGLLEIQSHALHSCPKLNYINLSKNHIRTIWRETFDKQELISHLDLSENALISVQRGCFGNDNLLLLQLAGNELQRVPIEALETTSGSLTTLDLSNNRLKVIDAPQFVGLRNVSHLKLSKNAIESVEEAAFEHLTNLRKLDIDCNPITSWSPTAFRDISHAIQAISLASTGLFNMPKINHRGVRVLNISSNSINDLQISDVEPFVKLTVLDISFNNMRSINPELFGKLVELKELNISGNPIENIPFDQFKHLNQLEHLHMGKMSFLQQIPDVAIFSNLTNLKSLKIYELAQHQNLLDMGRLFSYLPPLESLKVEIFDETLQSQFHKLDKRNLRELTIVGEKLREITNSALGGIRGFRFHLKIQNTSIATIPPELFNTWTGVNLITLSLQNNQIQHFNPFALKHVKPPVINQHGTILLDIHLQGNPIQCDCQFEWLRTWFEMIPEKRMEFKDVKCKNIDLNLSDAIEQQRFCVKSLIHARTSITFPLIFTFCYLIVTLG